MQQAEAAPRDEVGEVPKRLRRGDWGFLLEPAGEGLLALALMGDASWWPAARMTVALEVAMESSWHIPTALRVHLFESWAISQLARNNPETREVVRRCAQYQNVKYGCVAFLGNATRPHHSDWVLMLAHRLLKAHDVEPPGLRPMLDLLKRWPAT